MKYLYILLPLSLVAWACGSSGVGDKHDAQHEHADSFDAAVEAIMPEAGSKTDVLDYLSEEAQMPAAKASYTNTHAASQPTDIAKAKVKEPTFYALFKENITTTSLNIRKKPKAPERQGYRCSYEDDIIFDNADRYYFFGDYEYPLYGAVQDFDEDPHDGTGYSFNRRGDVAAEDLMMGDSQDPSVATYDYNSRGQLVDRTEWCFRENIGLGTYAYCSDTYKYDKRGNVVVHEQTHFTTLGEKNTYKYKYDSKGRIIEKICYTDDSPEIVPSEKYTWEYDSKGNVLEEAKYDEREALEYKYKCKYDSRGNRIEISHHGFSGPVSKKLLYYSADNILVLTEERNAEDAIYKIILYSYDKYGNMIKKREFDSSYNVTSEHSYKYDRRGNVIEESNGQDTLRYKITYYR